jgi:thioredoxin 1
MEPNTFQQIIDAESIVLVDFYAPWCGPCRKMMPVIDSLQAEYSSKVLVLKVNVDASKALVKQNKIASVPYFAVYKDGKLTFSHYGVVEKATLEREMN